MKARQQTKQALMQEVASLKQRIGALEKERDGIDQGQHFYKDFPDNATVGIAGISQEGRFTYLNAKFQELFGYDLSDLPDGRTWFRKAYPDATYRHEVIAAWLQDFEAALPGERKPRVFTVTCKDQQRKIVEFTTVKLTSGDYMMICTDITERKQAEDILRESEERYRTLIETSPDAILMYSLDGTILTVNDQLVRIYGAADAEDFFSEIRTVFDLLDEQGRARALNNFQHTLTTGESRLNEYSVRLRDGRMIPVDINSSVIRTADGRPKAFISVVRDISERRRSEEALRHSEQMFRNLFENANEAIAVTQDGRVVFMNPQLVRMVGYAAEEFMSRPFAAFIHPDDRDMVLDRHVRRLKGEDLPADYDYRIIRSDGEILWVNLNVIVIDWAGRGATLCFLYDITKRKQAENALRKSETEKKVILEGVSDMIFYIDRDMRVVYSNLAIEKFFNLPFGTMQGRPCFYVLHQRDRICSVCPATKAMESGNHEQAYVSSYGRHWRLNAFPVRDENGVITGAIEVAADITELREAEAKYRSIFENATEGIFQTTPDGRLINANPALAQIFGYDSPEAMMTAVTHLGRDLYADQEQRRKILRMLEEQGTINNVEFVGVKKDGGHIDVSINARAVRDKRGETSFYEGMLQDISERRRAERALRESEERYRMIAEHMSDVITIMDMNLRFTFISPSIFQLRGYTAEEAMSQGIEEVLTPTSLTLAADVYQEELAKEAGGTADPDRMRVLELEEYRKDGSTVWVESTLVFLRDHQGQATGILSVSRDIDARKRAEEALRESEERYRNLFSSHAAVKLIIDPDTGAIVEANRAAESYYGWSQEQLKHMNIKDINTLSASEIEKEIHRARLGEKMRFEFRHRRADGSVRDVEVFSSKIETPGKTLLHSIVHDITQRKQAEQAIQKSERKFRDLADLLPQVIFEFDLQGRFTYVNRYAFQLFGYAQEDFEKGVNALDMIVPAQRERAAANILKIMRNEMQSGSEYTAVRMNGEEFPVMIYSTPVYEGDRVVGLRGILIDITERKAAEEGRLYMEQQLKQAQKMEAIGTLAGGIAHDFNNLLMGIQGYASLMLLDLDPSHPHHERLKRIEEQVKSGADLTKQLLGFARGGRYETKPTDMNEIIDKTVSMFGRTRKEIVIQRSLKDDLWTVEVDRGQMEQVFMNLFVNAWQAMPGGGELCLETANILLDDDRPLPWMIKPGRYIKIAVADTGTGMDEKTRERIFDPFFTTKAMGRGTGLGLAMVYGIVKGHNGHIAVTSESGQGTTFEIFLPVTEKAVFREHAADIGKQGGWETILLVDDEKLVLDVTAELLGSLGYRVYPAGSGQEAIAVYLEKRNEIDLVILDMVMPGLSGGKTFERLREINPDIRVILSSGYSINGEAQKIIDKGCNGFLQKPFRMETLSLKVREVLEQDV